MLLCRISALACCRLSALLFLLLLHCWTAAILCCLRPLPEATMLHLCHVLMLRWCSPLFCLASFQLLSVAFYCCSLCPFLLAACCCFPALPTILQCYSKHCSQGLQASRLSEQQQRAQMRLPHAQCAPHNCRTRDHMCKRTLLPDVLLAPHKRQQARAEMRQSNIRIAVGKQHGQ